MPAIDTWPEVEVAPDLGDQDVVGVLVGPEGHGRRALGGGIVTISPVKGALGTFAPPLDAAGNSVRGQLASRWLSLGLGLDLFVSRAMWPTVTPYG